MGEDPRNAVHNAVVLEELAFMAYHTEAISPDVSVRSVSAVLMNANSRRLQQRPEPRQQPVRLL